MSEVIAFISNSLTISVFVGYIFALWAALAAWSWFDIHSRTDNNWFKLGTVLIVATGGILGFAIYLLLRPSITKDEIAMREIEEAVLASQSQFFTCPTCHYTIRDDFAYCPNCSLKLHSVCESCEREINITWNSCPYCGKDQGKKQKEEKEAEVLTPVEVVSEGKTRNLMLFSALSNWFKKRNKRSRRKEKISQAKVAASKETKTARKKKAKASI